MKKLLLFATLLGAAQLGPGCRHDADVRPGNYDTLAQATGHWDWEKTAYDAGPRTPASTGFTRYVVFGQNGQLTVKRNGQDYYQTGYRLSTRSGPAPTDSLATYASEKDLYNNDVKTYRIRQQNGQRVLTLVGELVPVDGGAIETYHWVAE